MARKLPGLQRVVGEETVFAIVYGEISASLYFALGIVALWALGLTPLVLLAAGLLVAIAAGAFAEGATAVDSPGGSAAITRRAFGDAAGFIIGWAVLLDLAVVISLALLYVPHYAMAAFGRPHGVGAQTDELIAIGLAVAIGAARLVRRTKLYRVTVAVATLDAVVQVVLVVLGLALVFDAHVLVDPIGLGTSPTWNALGYSLPIALIAFTGIEIVANMVRERRDTTRQGLALGTVAGIGATLLVAALLAMVALSAFPVVPDPAAPSGYASGISTTWLDAPLAGVGQQVGNQIGSGFGAALRAVVALSAVLLLLASATASFSGATRIIGALGEEQALPEVLTRTSRRSLAAPGAVALIVALVAVLLGVSSELGREGTALASIYSFGILLSFMAVFASIVWLRFTEPGLPRPVRMRSNIRFGRVEFPLLAVVGFALSWVTWILALGTHRAARIVPPLWLLVGAVVYVVVRRTRGLDLRGRVERVAAPPAELIEVLYGSILVPVKQAGPIEEEMLATASKLAAEQGARVIALKVIEVPLDLELDAPLPDEESAGERLRELAATFKEDYGIDLECRVVRGRAISGTIVAEAKAAEAGLILMGAVPRPSKQAGRERVFSETVENLLRRAHTRVIVTAFPPGTASVEPEPVPGPHGH